LGRQREVPHEPPRKPLKESTVGPVLARDLLEEEIVGVARCGGLGRAAFPVLHRLVSTSYEGLERQGSASKVTYHRS